jgi:hypothetical protein
MSPLLVAVLAIIAFFSVTAVVRWLRMELDHRRRPRRDHAGRRDRAP